MKLHWLIAACALSLCSLTAQGRVEDQLELGAVRHYEVEVQLQPEQFFVSASEDVRMTVTFANNGRDPVSLTKWFVPGEDFDLPLFEVTRDGVPVEYMGPIVKRMAPTTEDVIVLQPGEQITVPVELSGSYDFSAGGEFEINYRSRSSHLFGPDQRGIEMLTSQPVSISVESRAYSNVHVMGVDSKKGKPPGGGGGGGGSGGSSITFTGACTASQQTTLLSAITGATTIAAGAKTYLAGSPSATPRYTTWFGAYSSSGWNTASSHFVAIEDAFKNKPLTLDCSCRKSYYAYVYPTQPYKIYVCNAFWKAPLNGTDSKSGTLVHEMSHFDAVAGTDDWAYGQTAAKSLAISNPTRALNNADSHEYFAENTPSLN